MNRVVQPPARNVGVRDDVEQERDVRLHAADAELLQARSIRRAASMNRRPQAVTFTSSES